MIGLASGARMMLSAIAAATLCCTGVPCRAAPYSVEETTAYSFLSSLTGARDAPTIAWFEMRSGERKVWTAAAPRYAPRLLHTFGDDGQELTSLTVSQDGSLIIWARGGDHHANWRREDGLQPNPMSLPRLMETEIWMARAAGGRAVRLASGDAPVISSTGRIAFLHDGGISIVDARPGARPSRVLSGLGDPQELEWSPDGRHLVFVSNRRDHSFVGIYDVTGGPVRWLSPASALDETPRWAPDGRRIAFVRRPALGGAPAPLVEETPTAWSIVVADTATGAGRAIWRSPETPRGAYPQLPDGANLSWTGTDLLSFRAEMDGWGHLYTVSATGGGASLLTPGAFLAEHVTTTGKRLLFDANTGPDAEDADRRHVFSVDVGSGRVVAWSKGSGSEWTPVGAGPDRFAYIAAKPNEQPRIMIQPLGGGTPKTIYQAAPNAAVSAFTAPQMVLLRANDGVRVHGQLFGSARPGARRPAIIFVHGGPARQMLLGWSYMGYYSHAYAMNQQLAAEGYVVLSVNYRLGIGYGYDFQHAGSAGAAGASEYQDVLAAARYLKSRPDVDPDRIGIWGGSYGGYLTALALARDSAVFKAGVDLHGVHDWSRDIAEETPAEARFEQGDRAAALERAFRSSPVAAIEGWRSPILLIHGDDDRNVRFDQTIDLVRRLQSRGLPFEELVLPGETHDFLTRKSWLAADKATLAFFAKVLKP